MITQEIKNLRVGCRAIVSGYSGDYGTLHKSKDGRWYIFSNNYNMDGSKPEEEWESVKGSNSFSFWIGDGVNKETDYIIDIDSSFLEDVKPFNPQVGDILHIMSKEDIFKFNANHELTGGGEYFDHHFEVTSASLGTLYGRIFNKSGEEVKESWGLNTKDFYEFHGINPPSYATPYLVIRKEYDGSTTRTVETKKTILSGHTMDSSGSMRFGSGSGSTAIGSPSFSSSGAYSSISGGSSSSILGSSLSKSYVDEMSHASSEYIKNLIYEEKAKALEEYVSKDSIKHEGSRCTLPQTSDWQIAGDSVPRKKATDMLLILGL